MKRDTQFPIGLILFAMTLPSIVTWVYFVWLRDSPPYLQQAAYSIGKGVQFALPVAWCLGVLGERPGRLKFVPRDLAWGIGFGALIAAAIAALYLMILEPLGVFDGPALMIRAKVRGLGLATPARFIALGVFYAVGHSFLEEYYWRWFVFRACRAHASQGRAVVISSLGFMAHHVLLLAHYFGWASPLTWIFSISVAVGGLFWAWLYDRHRSLLAPWLSHLLVDAAIFAVGYRIASIDFA